LRCDAVLNSPDRVKGSVLDLKTPANNPDSALTATAQAGQDLRVPVVYVLNMRGRTFRESGAISKTLRQDSLKGFRDSTRFAGMVRSVS
jgi:hypothetical protein